MNKIWIVTYWDKNEEPTVTAFDNWASAHDCYLVFKESHDGACLDEVSVYHKFITQQKKYSKQNNLKAH